MKPTAERFAAAIVALELVTSCSSPGRGSASGDAGGQDATLGDDSGLDAALFDDGDALTFDAGLKGRIVSCPGGATTTLGGTVFDPAGKNPLYNVVVYVPNSPLRPLPQAVACTPCSDLFSGDPIASAVTDASGHFMIRNVPAAQNLPLVVQVGKWRRLYTVPSILPCQDNHVLQKLTLPTRHDPTDPTVGDIPNIAISTGGEDSLECLFARMGVAASEYTGGAYGTGRIHIFTGSGGASAPSRSVPSSQGLWDSTNDLLNYDLVVLSCEGQENASLTKQNRQSLFEYAASGGHAFASHFHYDWFDTGPFATANLATWAAGANSIDDRMSFPVDVVIAVDGGQGAVLVPGTQQPFARAAALQQWLGNVGALTNGRLPIWFARHNVTATNAPAQAWLALDPSTPAPDATQYFSFDTPLDPALGRCGRVAYSDLHATGGPGTNAPGVPPDYPSPSGAVVPDGCAIRPLTPQEKALEFFFFDLSSSCLISAAPSKGPPPVP